MTRMDIPVIELAHPMPGFPDDARFALVRLREPIQFDAPDGAPVGLIFVLLVPERANVDGGAPIRSDQVDNMNYLLRLDDGVVGTMQVSFTAWFGTGNRFEIYGTEGMLMLATEASPDWQKDGGKGDPTRGELKLYGARADIDAIVASPVPPERLQRQFFHDSRPPDRHCVVRPHLRKRDLGPNVQRAIEQVRPVR